MPISPNVGDKLAGALIAPTAFPNQPALAVCNPDGSEIGFPTAPVTGALVSDATIALSSTGAIITTGSLAVGTWSINFDTLMTTASSSGLAEITAILGSATATFAGCYSTQIDTSLQAGTHPLSCGLSFTVVVTVAGTITIQCKNNSSTNSVVFKAATTGAGAYTNATGYTAVRVF